MWEFERDDALNADQILRFLHIFRSVATYFVCKSALQGPVGWILDPWPPWNGANIPQRCWLECNLTNMDLTTQFSSSLFATRWEGATKIHTSEKWQGPRFGLPVVSPLSRNDIIRNTAAAFLFSELHHDSQKYRWTLEEQQAHGRQRRRRLENGYQNCS